LNLHFRLFGQLHYYNFLFDYFLLFKVSASRFFDVFLSVLDLFSFLGHLLADKFILIFEEFLDLDFDLLESFGLSLLDLSFSCFEVSGFDFFVDFFLFGDDRCCTLAHVADIESCWILECASWAYPGHHAHFFFCDFLILFLLFLFHLFHYLFFYEFVDVPAIDENEAVSILKEDVQ
jgi:hypothetical protein